MNYINRPEPALKKNAETEAELETRLDSRDTQKGHAGHSKSGPRSSPCTSPGTSPERHQDQRGTDETGRKSSVADGRGAAGAAQGFTGRQGSRRTSNLLARTIGAHQECGEKANTKLMCVQCGVFKCDFPCPPNQCDRGSDRRRQTRALGVRADWYAEPARPGSAADQTSPGWLDRARQINRINPPTSGMNGAAPSAYSVDFLDTFGAGAHKGNKDSRIFSNPYS
uniref:Uncharacterized protein n=1 Tax=Knipowitschia caucasica TaxID=637954 RepID=A0AAV2MPN8_KNICA